VLPATWRGVTPPESPQVFEPLLAPAHEGGDALWFVFHRRRLLLVDGKIPSSSVQELGLPCGRTLYVGRLGLVHVHAAELDAEPMGPLMAVHELRSVFGRIPDEHQALAGRAVQLLEWDRTHQFCGACATPTQRSTESRSRVCPKCGLAQFPRVSPAIIVAVERGDEILLARAPHFPPGIHSVLAGFVEPGESVEDAVHREVLEEVGVHLRNVRYFGSQPWPFPHSLMLGFQAHWHDGEVRPFPPEIESGAFYRHDQQPMRFPGRVSISQWLIADFLKRHGVK